MKTYETLEKIALFSHVGNFVLNHPIASHAILSSAAGSGLGALSADKGSKAKGAMVGAGIGAGASLAASGIGVGIGLTRLLQLTEEVV